MIAFPEILKSLAPVKSVIVFNTSLLEKYNEAMIKAKQIHKLILDELDKNK